jgi:hypothetical protein
MPLEEQIIQAQIIRKEGYNLDLGKFLIYQLKPFKFGILVSRNGIEIQGNSPNFTSDTLRIFREMIDRAEAHHRHLASFPPGTHQAYLSEKEALDHVTNKRAFENTPRLVQ